MFVTNDHDEVCDSFENVNFSEDLAVITKRYNQIESCTAIDETLLVLNGWPELKRDCPKLIHQYWPFRDEITTQDGILYKGQTVIIPTSMRREMLEAIHYSHLGQWFPKWAPPPPCGRWRLSRGRWLLNGRLGGAEKKMGSNKTSVHINFSTAKLCLCANYAWKIYFLLPIRTFIVITL